MRNILHIALIGMVCLMSAPAAQGQRATVDDQVISQQAVTTVDQYASIGEVYTLQAAGCCDQGWEVNNVAPSVGCCDQGWQLRSQIVSGRTLVAIAAMAALLLAASVIHRFTTNKQQSQWT
jgi:hypothetical protein